MPRGHAAPKIARAGVAVTLHVHTASLKRSDIASIGDLLDISRGTGGPAGAPWAPSWQLLRPTLAGLRRGGVAAEAAWAAYRPAFVAEMRASYRSHRDAWNALLARDTVTLACHCRDRSRCHRDLVTGLLVKLGAVDLGELPPPPSRQRALPGM